MFTLRDNKNKIAVILILALLIIFASLVGGYYYSGRSLPTKQPTNNQANIKQEQNINKQNISQAQEKVVAEKKEEVKATDCEKVNNAQQKASCTSLAVVNSALSNLDYGACNKIGQEWQDICIYKIAERASGSRIDQSEKCATIKDKLTRSMCYKFAAAMLNKVKLCDLDAIDKEECVGYTIDFNNKQGLTGCKDIKSGSWFYTCVLKNTGDCSVLKEKDFIAKCQSWQLFDKIVASQQAKDCAKLPLENFRKVCEIALSGQGFIDSDSDGVNNYEELIFGTDPFKFGSDAKEILQRESQISSFANNLYDQTANGLYDLMVAKATSDISKTASSTK
jgi:hypothetical protein